MIRKIQCMVAKFNGEAALQTKYCGVCADDKKVRACAHTNTLAVYGALRQVSGLKM